MNDLLERVREELTDVMAGAIAQLPAIFAGILLFLAFVFLSKRVKRFVSTAIKLKTGDVTTAVIFERLAATLVIILGLLISAGVAFPQLSFDSLIATLGLTSIAVGFAFKDVFENFVAGLILLLSRSFSIGDVLRLQGITGKVEEIGIRSISIRQFDGELVLIPAVKVVGDVVTVVTNQAARRFELVLGISYDSDVDQAVRIVREGVEDVEGVLDSPAPVVLADVFNASSVDLKIYYWVDTSVSDVFGTRSKVVDHLKKVLESNNIEIPYPMQTTIIKSRSNSTESL